MPKMQAMRPCARCEQELPEAFYDTPDSHFCKRCSREVTELLRRKYTIIEAAHFRAQLRRRSRVLQQRLTQSLPTQAAATGAGD